MNKTIGQRIYNRIVDFIRKCGSPFSKWNVGITSDPEARLFTEHNVSKKNGSWIYEDAETADTARAVEKFIIEEHGTQGGTGGGDELSTYVYAYRITNYTKE